MKHDKTGSNVNVTAAAKGQLRKSITSAISSANNHLKESASVIVYPMVLLTEYLNAETKKDTEIIGRYIAEIKQKVPVNDDIWLANDSVRDRVVDLMKKVNHDHIMNNESLREKASFNQSIAAVTTAACFSISLYTIGTGAAVAAPYALSLFAVISAGTSVAKSFKNLFDAIVTPNQRINNLKKCGVNLGCALIVAACALGLATAGPVASVVALTLGGTAAVNSIYNNTATTLAAYEDACNQFADLTDPLGDKINVYNSQDHTAAVPGSVISSATIDTNRLSIGKEAGYVKSNGIDVKGSIAATVDVREKVVANIAKVQEVKKELDSVVKPK